LESEEEKRVAVVSKIWWRLEKKGGVPE